MAAIEDFLADAKRRMDRSIEATHHEFNSIRTGRASPALLDRITIDYYGTPTPLKSLASIGAPEPRLLTVQPFDPGSMKSIERAIQESDLGLTPSNDGKIVRLPIPTLTEERRKELVKVVRRVAEDGRWRSGTCAATSSTTSASSWSRERWVTTRSAARSSRCRRSPTSTRSRSTTS